MDRVPSTVSVKWLSDVIKTGDKAVRVVDGSWHLPVLKRNAREEYDQGHIEGAVFFDFMECRDTSTDIPYTIPPPDKFAQYVGNLGISNDHHVIVYDNNEKFGMFSAQRVWWMFRVFGQDKVSVLDGGLPKWLSEGHSVTAKNEQPEGQKFKALNRPDLVKNFNDMVLNLKEKTFQVVDARPSAWYNGEVPEPRPDMKSGHIPGAISIPFSSTLDTETKLMKTKEELEKMFTDAGVDLKKPLISMCGSGINACSLVLAAFICNKDVPVYDGSWLEWGRIAQADQIEI